ncbi:hypothetical protein [Methanosarcina sp.]|uniref:hypothetical protein n=1 Tax=Methanosarcina sp. TaxID=2213 RepID=UPI002988463A|nr:hypothetical protein [Methanosarcina sp.]MDW5550289.1 hypothetical protein [Methanosarcina sp.]MDW5554117.1 hypothetical protein [Methanosarcina sp.]MDW5560312.1 hypothetical protein [Methanosarcina sp.]
MEYLAGSLLRLCGSKVERFWEVRLKGFKKAINTVMKMLFLWKAFERTAAPLFCWDHGGPDQSLVRLSLFHIQARI